MHRCDIIVLKLESQYYTSGSWSSFLSIGERGDTRCALIAVTTVRRKSDDVHWDVI